MPDIERMLRDATEDRWDSHIFEYPFKEAIDPSSLAWYRNRFNEMNDGFDPKVPDKDFLAEWGFLVKQGRSQHLTRAAIALFGSNRAFRQMLSRPTLDLQFIGARKDDDLPEMRWIDRYVSEENIINTWRQLVTKYLFFMPNPFQGIDPHTLARQDTPPSFRVFREASINLFIHQDYGDHSRKAVIKFFQDGIYFWNPGDVFGSDENLLEPGEKEVRNPKITAGIRRLVLCEQAGTGMRMMSKLWREQKHPAPKFINDRNLKAFEIYLPGLDVDLGGTSRLMGPFAGAGDKISFGQTEGPDNEKIVGGESRGRVGGESGGGSIQSRILRLLEQNTLSKKEIAAALGQRKANRYLDESISKSIKDEIIEYTIPDKPNSRLQQYRITEKGKKIIRESRNGSRE
jgi:ATP-dependent DNA helicase RecG